MEHNKDSANILLAFQQPMPGTKNEDRNQLKIYLDNVFGTKHTAEYVNNHFIVRKRYHSLLFSQFNITVDMIG